MVALGQLFLDSEHVNEEYWKRSLWNMYLYFVFSY